MTGFADLHIHTFYSDGTLSPQEVVEEAHQGGLSCIAVTDHDVLDGIPACREAAQKYGLEVISGVELSSEENGKEIHILGYLFDDQNPALAGRLKQMQDGRLERMKKMIEKLEGLGIKTVKWEDVVSSCDTKSWGRPHLAMVLKEKGVVSSLKQAFDRYLAEGAPAYVPKIKQTPREAIQLIRDAGGIAVLAHPMLTNVDELIPSFVRAGLGGLEVYYPYCSENLIYFYEGLARKHSLAVTGGSDAHGDAKKHTFIGRTKIPYELVEKLKQAVRGQ